MKLAKVWRRNALACERSRYENKVSSIVEACSKNIDDLIKSYDSLSERYSYRYDLPFSLDGAAKVAEKQLKSKYKYTGFDISFEKDRYYVNLTVSWDKKGLPRPLILFFTILVVTSICLGYIYATG